MTHSTTPEPGLVSCLCVTRGDVCKLERAVRCWRDQTYPTTELVLVAQGLDDPCLKMLSKVRGRVRIDMAAPGVPLGTLRNRSIAVASGEYLAQWDDDDWYSPLRLEEQLAHLQATDSDACMLARWTVLNELTRQAYVSCARQWEGSLLCRRDVPAIAEGYPPMHRGEDQRFVQLLNRTCMVTTLDRPELYVYCYHGENTWDAQHFRVIFESGTELARPYAEQIARKVIGAPPPFVHPERP